MSRPAPRHNRTTSTHFGIARGSLQHIALRVLDTTPVTAVALLAMMPEAQHFSAHQFLKQVVLPLDRMGLLHPDRTTLTWGTTDQGNTAARSLGPIPVTDGSIGRDSRDAANDGDTLPPAHVPGIQPAPCRPRLAMGTADHRPPARRPGAMDATTLPSRMGSRLHWPDGRVTEA